ncbi:MAG: hypothetical protein CL912_13260 [Deltaproteobacteria bacterium]|nr:hypothetical protein [Deltaproteobacteria bacterium]
MPTHRKAGRSFLFSLQAAQSSHPSTSTPITGNGNSNQPPQQRARDPLDPIESMLFSDLNADRDQRFGDGTQQVTARERFMAGLRQNGRTDEEIRDIMEVYDRVH